MWKRHRLRLLCRMKQGLAGGGRTAEVVTAEGHRRTRGHGVWSRSET